MLGNFSDDENSVDALAEFLMSVKFSAFAL